MTLLFCDGFDSYDTANITTKWTAKASSATIVTGGRLGNCLNVAPNLFGNVQKTIPNTSTIIVGFAFKYEASYQNSQDILSFQDISTVQTNLRLLPSGQLQMFQSANNVLGSPTSIALKTNTYHFIEIKTNFDSSAGTVDIHIDGVSALSLTGLNTKASSNSYCNKLFFGAKVAGGLNGNWKYDDLYVCDTNGSTNNAFLGDIRVESLYPNGAGNSTQLTASTGTNWSCVDETPPNTTDYVTSSGNGQIDEYTFTDLATTSGSIYGVQLSAQALKETGATETQIALVDRTNATDHVGSTQALTTSYAYYSQILETDSGNASNWTVSNINGAQFGIKAIT